MQRIAKLLHPVEQKLLRYKKIEIFLVAQSFNSFYPPYSFRHMTGIIYSEWFVQSIIQFMQPRDTVNFIQTCSHYHTYYAKKYCHLSLCFQQSLKYINNCMYRKTIDQKIEKPIKQITLNLKHECECSYRKQKCTILDALIKENLLDEKVHSIFLNGCKHYARYVSEKLCRKAYFLHEPQWSISDSPIVFLQPNDRIDLLQYMCSVHDADDFISMHAWNDPYHFTTLKLNYSIHDNNMIKITLDADMLLYMRRIETQYIDMIKNHNQNARIVSSIIVSSVIDSQYIEANMWYFTVSDGGCSNNVKKVKKIAVKNYTDGEMDDTGSKLHDIHYGSNVWFREKCKPMLFYEGSEDSVDISNILDHGVGRFAFHMYAKKIKLKQPIYRMCVYIKQIMTCNA
jgi:hypothetical protein